MSRLFTLALCAAAAAMIFSAKPFSRESVFLFLFACCFIAFGEDLIKGEKDSLYPFLFLGCVACCIALMLIFGCPPEAAGLIPESGCCRCAS